MNPVKRAASHAAVFLLWSLHFLPASWLRVLGHRLGRLLWRLGASRRQVVRTNLRLCFPDLDEAAREAIARRNFALMGRSFVERSVLWWGSPERVRQLVRVEGIEHLRAQAGRPVILLGAHLVGMDHAVSRLSMDVDLTGIYGEQTNAVFDRMMKARRTRFGRVEAFSRQDGIKAAIDAMLRGKAMMYLPDMDFGPKHAIFVPFFGVPAATLTSLARLVASTGAAVVPALTFAEGDGWVVRIEPAWRDYPCGDDAVDARRLNAFIEERARPAIEQYWWAHRRFKTRPPGEKKCY